MKKFFAGRPLARFKEFLAERPLARFALLSFSLPIITLILLVVFAQIPQDVLSSNEPCHEEDGNIILLALSLLIPPLVAFQFCGTAGLIFYSVIINNKALRQVGIKNVALLVIGSVLTTLAFFFVNELICSSSHDWIRFATVAIFQLSSTSIIIVVRYTFWKISMMKFFAERPIVRFALLSFSLPIITLILLIVFVQISQDIWHSLDNGGLRHAKDVLSSLISLPVVLQFFGITGLIFYGGIVNGKVFTQVGIKNVALLVTGSVLTTLAFFFICQCQSGYFSRFSHDPLPGVAKLQLISTSILIAIRYAFWKRKQRMAKG